MGSQFQLPFPRLETFLGLTKSCARAYVTDSLAENSEDVGKRNFRLIKNIANETSKYKSFFTLYETVLKLEQSKKKKKIRLLFFTSSFINSFFFFFFLFVVAGIPHKTDTLEIIQMETPIAGHYDGDNQPIESNIVVWSAAGEVCMCVVFFYKKKYF
jgi:hypothetical protein